MTISTVIGVFVILLGQRSRFESSLSEDMLTNYLHGNAIGLLDDDYATFLRAGQLHTVYIINRC